MPSIRSSSERPNGSFRAIERTDGDNTVPLTHEQLATLLGVGRSYTSRVIQTFKAEGILETRRGRFWSAIWTRCASGRAFAMKPSKTTLRKCCEESTRSRNG